MKDTLIDEETNEKKTSIVVDEIGSQGINQYPLEKDINSRKVNKSQSTTKNIKLFLIISGIISLFIIIGILSFIFLIKKDQDKEVLPPKIDTINMNFSSYKDSIFPLSLDFSDYSGSKGYRVSHEALEVLEPEREEDIFETELLNVTKKTSLERILNTRAGLGGSVDFSNSAIGSLSGKISYENIVSQKNVKNYWSVSLLVKRKKVELDRRKIKVKKEVENELLEIIKNDSKYPDKSSKVNKLFKEISEKYGIFVPLEITYGGRFEFTFESETQENRETKAYNLNLALKLLNIPSDPDAEATFIRNETLIEIISKISKSINIIGGNYLVTAFEDLPNWYNSLDIENYGIVSFSGKSYLWDYFSNSTKAIFDEYTEEIEKKLDDFYGKFHLLQGLVKDHPPGLWKDGGDGNKQKEFKDGSCDYDFIVQKALPKVEEDNWHGSHCQYKDTLDRPTSQVLVGYRLKTCNPADSYDQGGDFELPEGDPILTNKYYFTFSNWPLGTLNCWQLTLCYVDLEDN